MSDFTKFAPRNPESFTVSEGKQTRIAIRSSDRVCAAMYITNNSDTPVYLGFTAPGDTKGNAAVGYGITVFPKSVMVFDDPVPAGCSIWATCEAGTAVVGVQQ